MNIYTVATNPKYNHWHVNRFLEQLGKYYTAPFKLFCYTDTPHNISHDVEVVDIPKRTPHIHRQWNKIDFFGASFMPHGQPVIVADLDWTFLRDITDIIETPISSGEFIGIRRWWYKPSDTLYTINGGMYKFISGELNHIYDVFHDNPNYWQTHYVRIGKAQPPINGEQNFVKERAEKTHKIKYFEPFDEIGRYPADKSHLEEYNVCYNLRSNHHDWFFLDGEFNPRIRMVHSIL